jgi:hypothetical protein
MLEVAAGAHLQHLAAQRDRQTALCLAIQAYFTSQFAEFEYQ